MENQIEMKDQYSLGKILFIWAAVSLPMPILAFGPLPKLISAWTGLFLGYSIFIAIGIGLTWQFIFGCILLYKELDDFTWSTIKERLWINKPRDPKTGQPTAKLFWVVLPLLLLYLFIMFVIGPSISEFLIEFYQSVIPEEFMLDSSVVFAATQPGDWWVLGLFIWIAIFNYILGEEFIFRGILLPKMQKQFGKWDWLANAILFSFYHLHLFPRIPIIFLNVWIYSWGARRYRSTWIAIIIHGTDGVFILTITTLLILGI